MPTKIKALCSVLLRNLNTQSWAGIRHKNRDSYTRRCKLLPSSNSSLGLNKDTGSVSRITPVPILLDSSSLQKQLLPEKTILVAVNINKEEYENEENLLKRNQEIQWKAAMFAAIMEAIWRTFIWDLERMHGNQIFHKQQNAGTDGE